jgi:hypothetical protein
MLTCSKKYKMTNIEKVINDCVSPLNPHQRKILQDLSKVRSDHAYSTRPNAPMEEYVAMLHDLYPEKFHNKHTLAARVFVDAPSTIGTPYARHVRTRDESPYITLIGAKL